MILCGVTQDIEVALKPHEPLHCYVVDIKNSSSTVDGDLGARLAVSERRGRFCVHARWEQCFAVKREQNSSRVPVELRQEILP